MINEYISHHSSRVSQMMLDVRIKKIINHTLALNDRYSEMTKDTYLLGNIPELDSVSIISIILTLEKEFAISIQDDEISAATFSTLGTLTKFIEKKVNEKSVNALMIE
ncbi:MAG: phosphopantetheine-binding protein [Nitrosomonas sp.]|nr:phosphopantetheine-binding protein [Nitrosomonas sp.]